jgi:hypothetical protein
LNLSLWPVSPEQQNSYPEVYRVEPLLVKKIYKVHRHEGFRLK